MDERMVCCKSRRRRRRRLAAAPSASTASKLSRGLVILYDYFHPFCGFEVFGVLFFIALFQGCDILFSFGCFHASTVVERLLDYIRIATEPTTLEMQDVWP
jgi:hypothetical protein